MIKIFFVYIKMSYYKFDRQELLQKMKDKYYNCGGKGKAAKYYIKNNVLKENIKYKSLSEEKKEAKREYGENRYRHMTKIEKTA